ncbi:MAG: class I SAM-dependent methyltransferase, partial [Solirubrobacterales bacterium]|nr:class I SAM-dependent methyltransferase [Solirubrobacterales bacterium]
SLENVTTLVTRSEDLARGEARESFDLVTARAVAPLDALAELGAPLLKTGGSLVAWKGEPEPEGEAAVLRTSDRTGMTVDRSVPVRPYSSSRERRLYILKKIAPTSDNLPRRPGLARKRPLAGRRSN